MGKKMIILLSKNTNMLHQKLEAFRSSGDSKTRECIDDIFKKIIEPAIELHHGRYDEIGNDVNNDTLDIGSDFSELDFIKCINDLPITRTELLCGDVQSGKTRAMLALIWLTNVVCDKQVFIVLRNINADADQLQNAVNTFNGAIGGIMNAHNVSENYKIFPVQSTSSSGGKMQYQFNTHINYILLSNPTQIQRLNKQALAEIVRTKKLINGVLIVDECDMFWSSAKINSETIDENTKTERCISVLKREYKLVIAVTATGTACCSNCQTDYPYQTKTDEKHNNIEEKNVIKINNPIDRVFILKQPAGYHGLTSYEHPLDFRVVAEKIRNSDERYITTINVVKDIMKDTNQRRIMLGSEYYMEVHEKMRDDILENNPDSIVVIYNGNEISYNSREQLESPNLPVSRYRGLYTCEYTRCSMDDDNKMLIQLQEMLEFVYSTYPNKHVALISGRYADRGISFTNSSHTLLPTDQIILDAGTMTQAYQKLRCQGIKPNCNKHIIVWTTREMKEYFEKLRIMYHSLNETLPYQYGHTQIFECYNSILSNFDKKFKRKIDSKRKSRNIDELYAVTKRLKTGDTLFEDASIKSNSDLITKINEHIKHSKYELPEASLQNLFSDVEFITLDDAPNKINQRDLSPVKLFKTYYTQTAFRRDVSMYSENEIKSILSDDLMDELRQGFNITGGIRIMCYDNWERKEECQNKILHSYENNLPPASGTYMDARINPEFRNGAVLFVIGLNIYISKLNNELPVANSNCSYNSQLFKKINNSYLISNPRRNLNSGTYYAYNPHTCRIIVVFIE